MQTTHRFGRFEVLATQRQILCDGQPLTVGARAFDVLLALLAHPGKLVTKDALLDQAWPGLVVEEANVHVQISQLRKLLGADAIGTVAGLGYRFTLPLAGGPTRHNLPAERTPFVGRDAALAEARLRLAHTRLLTLIGIGGTGKTRLALKLAEQSLGDALEAVWWVDLAPVESGEQLAPAVAQAIGCTVAAGSAVTDALVSQLGQADILLVLDNCEHLLDAVAALADTLLAAAPGLRLLATSREALDLAGETVLPVRPLDIPPAGAAPGLALQTESVRLFARRAQAASPGLELEGDNVVIAAEICRRLDGIPLALELAAAQLRVISPRQLLALLAERFRLLVGNRRALSRQQTLSAVIQWSHDHLRPDDQRLLRNLAVCAGGCELDAASALLGPQVSNAVMLSGLARLAQLSLIDVQQVAPSARYVLLETVRQFALERVHDSGEMAQARERHAAFYLGLAEVLAAVVEAQGQGAAAIAQLDRERDNLLRALDWWDRDDDPASVRPALRMVAALRHYWPARGLLALGLALTRRTVARARGQPYDRAQMNALIGLAQLLAYVGEHESARQQALHHLDLASAAGDATGITVAHLMIGSNATELGRMDEAMSHLQAALQAARAANDTRREGHALGGMALIATVHGRHDEASAHFDAVLALRRANGHGYDLAVALLNSVSNAIECQARDRARERLVETLALAPRLGSRYITVHLLGLTANLLCQYSDWLPAVELHAAAQTQWRELGLFVDEQRRAQQQRDLGAARQALGDAAFEQAWNMGLAIDELAGLGLAALRLESVAAPLQ